MPLRVPSDAGKWEIHRVHGMGFDRDLSKYDELKRHIEAAGFHWTIMPTLDDEDQECGPPRFICASIRFPGGVSGNSFWVLKNEAQWFCGTWGGFCYSIADPQRISEMCIAWMTRNPDKTKSDFDDFIKHSFDLIAVSDDELDAASKRSD